MSTIEVESSLQGRNVRHYNTMAGDNGLPESYHLDGGPSFGIWAYRMKNLLLKDGRFHYCITPPSPDMSDEERMARQQVLSIINSNAKNNALRLLRRYSDPYECWTGLKTRYESDSGPRRVMLIEKFFALRKTESVSMDAHLTEVKEIASLLEEVDVVIPEDIIVYYTLKNLPKEYDIFKRMQIAAQTLPTYEQLEAKLISEETSIKMETQQYEEGEAFFVQRDRTGGRRTPHNARFNNNRHSYRRNTEFGGFPSQRSSTSSTSALQGGASPFRPQGQPPTFDSAPRIANHSASYQPRFKARGPDRPRSSQCNFCGIGGHYERECDLKSILDRIKDYEHCLVERRQRTHSGQVHNLEETDEENKPDSEDFSADQVVDACLVELNLLETPQQNPSWYLDSGATHHVSGDPSVFSSLRPTNGAQLRSAGGQSHNVTGVGNVDLQVLSGNKNVSSVLYTPGITKNLLSVGALTDQQKTLVFRSKFCYVIDNTTAHVEALASRENAKGLYRLQTGLSSPAPEVHSLRLHSQTSSLPRFEANRVRPHSQASPSQIEANSLRLRSQAALWHRRLGHFHARGMTRMLASEAVKGMPKFTTAAHICTGCRLGKQVKTKMPKETSFHASKPLELIHSDVCGPFRVMSTGGARYFVTFIDDFSKKTWIYFLAHKSQVLEKFKHFVHLVENLTGLTVRALRTDNGGEYTSRLFSEFCSHKGITREMPPPYTPQRNGVAERRNRSILDITRSLLLDKGLPRHLWGEAVKAAGDILNLRTTKKHPDMTPNELFFGKKPSIAHLRVFGSPVFVHIPKSKRTKLDPRSEKCILLSFDDTAKAYRCYRPSTRKIFVSRDIFIDEDSTFDLPAMAACDSSPKFDFTPSQDFPSPPKKPASQPLLPILPQSPQPDVSNAPSFCIDSPSLGASSPSPSTIAPSPQLTDSPVSTSSLSPGLPVPRRSDRIRRFPRHLENFAAHVELDSCDTLPTIQPELTFHDVKDDPLWQAAMQAEIDSIQENHTWTLVELPQHKQAISSKWVYKVKTSTNGHPPRHKARLVARGFEQQDGTDFLDTFAPVVRWETIRTLIAIAVHLNWPIHQLDVLTAFLNGILAEDVYMHQPLGFIRKGAEHLVCKLHKALYGLKQSPRAWYARLHSALLAWNLIQSHSDPNLYFAHIGNHTIALLVYVDDILITGSDLQLITKLKAHLQQHFKTNDLGSINKYLGVQFDRDLSGLRMHQTEYALSILHLFGMDQCTPSPTPLPEGLVLSKDSNTPPVNPTLYRMLVGKLLFLTKTRPDLTHAVSVISRFMQNPQEAHLQAAKHVLRYIRRYPDLGLFFKQGEENRLHGYTDADYAQDIDDRISIGAYIFFIGNSPVSWNSKKQSSTSRSTCESEYRALAQCSCEAIWLRRLLGELKILDDKPTHLYCDNQSSIKLSYNPVFHERSKHFEVDFHFTRQKVENNSIQVEFISSQEQPADILTKSLGKIKFEECRLKLHLRGNPNS